MTAPDFYTRITALPLLQGICADDILHMQERGALRIVSAEPEEGDIIVQGQHCKTLTMLMQGRLLCTTQGADWTLTEEINAPAIIEEEALWSLTQRYSHSYRAATEGRLVVIDRQQMMQTMLRNEVFRINLLTRLSTRIERSRAIWQSPTPRDTEGKILMFFRQISHTAHLPKHLNIKMTTLALAIDETRLNVSRALHRMQQQGIIRLSREQITLLEMPEQKQDNISNDI